MSFKKSVSIVFFCLFLLACRGKEQVLSFVEFSWNDTGDRTWIGADFWANGFQNWAIKNHRLNCVRPGGLNTLHVLSSELTEGDFKGKVTLGKNEVALKDSLSKCGLVVGLSDTNLNYKARLTISRFTLKEDGLWIGINGKQEMFVEELASQKTVLSKPLSTALIEQIKNKGMCLLFSGEVNNDSLNLFVRLENIDGYELHMTVPKSVSRGNITFMLSSFANGAEYFFDDFSLTGSALSLKPQRKFGPISTCLYSFNDKLLNLSAQLIPFDYSEKDSIVVELKQGENWIPFKTLSVQKKYGIATLRSFEWTYTTKISYRLKYKRENSFEGDYYEGIISPPDEKKDNVKMGVLSCNGMPFIERAGMDYWQIWKPYEILEQQYKTANVDLLIFLGDQMYEGRPAPLDWDKTFYPQEYQYRWMLWCLQFNAITSQLPTLILMDDHDYFQGNLWGDNNRIAETEIPSDIPAHYKERGDDFLMDNGGFMIDTALMNYAVILQTSHLPITYSKEKRAVNDYYTTLKFNGVGIALLEDRKYKSSPLRTLPNVASYTGFPLNDAIAAEKLHNEKAQLLNEEQLKMLEEWSNDWREEHMKIVFTQSIYSCLNSVIRGYNPLTGKNISVNDTAKYSTHLSKDMDSNGWPKSGRDKALKAVRLSSALLVGGDQHFCSVIQHGVENFGDAAYGFSIPAVSSSHARFWLPDSSDCVGQNKYIDGFGNKLNMIAFSNPTKIENAPDWLQSAPGYAFITCDKKSQSYSIDCWNFKSSNTQAKGWPIQVKVSDNAYASSVIQTPIVKVKNHVLPLVSVFNSANQKLYSVRSNNKALNVPFAGKYKIIIQDDSGWKKEIMLETGEGEIVVE